MAGMFVSPEFYDHYAYFPAAFIALLLGVCAGRIVDGGRWIAARLRSRRARGLAVGVSFVPVAAVLVAGVLAIPQDATALRDYLSTSDDPGTVRGRPHPPRCVRGLRRIGAGHQRRSVQPRGTRLPRQCRSLRHVDWPARTANPPPGTRPFPAAFVNDWRSWLERADYVVLSVPQSDYLPWTPELVTWFNKNYLLVSSQPRTYVYNHFTRAASGSAQALLQEGITADARGNLPLARSDFRSHLSAWIRPTSTRTSISASSIKRPGSRAWRPRSTSKRSSSIRRFAPAPFSTFAILTTPTSPSKAIALYRQIPQSSQGDANTEFNLGILPRAGGAVRRRAGDVEHPIHTSPSLRSSLPTGITVP